MSSSIAPVSFSTLGTIVSFGIGAMGVLDVTLRSYIASKNWNEENKGIKDFSFFENGLEV